MTNLKFNEAKSNVLWTYLNFEDALCEVKYTSKVQRKNFKDFGTYPIISQESEFINGYWDLECDLFRIENPLVIFGDHTKVIKYVDFNFVLGADGVKILNPISKINAKFLAYFLMSCQIPDLGYARHYRLLKEISVPAPPLIEQMRIVAILDQVFADIEQARANTEQNLKNARELFESYLQQVFSHQSKIFGDVWLSHITESISDGDHSAPPKSEIGVPFITISNINKSSNEVDFSNTFMVPVEYYKSLKAQRRPQLNDILYTVTGSYGIPVLVNEAKEFCFQRHIGLIRPKDNINSSWLYYSLMSPQVFSQADLGATGTAQKTVSLKTLRGISVPNAPLDAQMKALADINLIYRKSKILEGVYISKLTSLEELKKAIIQKAFSGELTK